MKNKTHLLLCAFSALTLFICAQASAQTVPPSKFRFGIGADALIPVGNTSTVANFGLGITPRLQYGVSDRFALTFTSGLYHFFPKTVNYPASGSFAGFTTQYKSNIIPVKAGFKFFAGGGFYVSGEAGVAFEVAEGKASSHFLWSPGIGYATKKWDIGARYENFSGNHYSDGVTALRVAYGFGL
ncbi:hypothetical protein [Mucilaginibacter auburnensis]|uniref:Outer membrane protein with beta-barrel domain n=1 Tax=Mucilaginibacter auburnensis TaxID=1457233 RepID=A0A2H9VR80_9SPHI|nr:hypothetical protein [Mucilaginibacter auburnensis]PJJ83336.1 hypothetical protein CLV57_0316 [Mucilaginibacter auburnensis]